MTTKKTTAKKDATAPKQATSASILGQVDTRTRKRNGEIKVKAEWAKYYQNLLELRDQLLKAGAVKYNEKKRLIETKSGFEFPLLFRRGGMRALYQGWLKVLELLTKEGGLEYLQERVRYEERIEELWKALGDEYWKYIDPIPPTPPQ